MIKDNKKCLLLISFILLLPSSIFLLIAGLVIPPQSLSSWFYWTLSTFFIWVTFLAAIVQIGGYDLRSICKFVTKAGTSLTSPNDLSISVQKLLEVLDKNFDLEELQNLCFELNEDFDNLRGEGKIAKSRELIKKLERKKRLTDLINTLQNKGISLD